MMMERSLKVIGIYKYKFVYILIQIEKMMRNLKY